MKVNFYYKDQDYADFCGATSESYVAYPEVYSELPKIGEKLDERFGSYMIPREIEEITSQLVERQGDKVESYNYYLMTYDFYEDDSVDTDYQVYIAIKKEEVESKGYTWNENLQLFCCLAEAQDANN